MGIEQQLEAAFQEIERLKAALAQRDDADNQRAETEAAHLAAIVQHSDDAIIGKNLQSIVTSWNRGAEKLFGYTADEMLGSSIVRLIPANRQAEETHILNQIILGCSVEHFETVRQAKDGRLLDISVTVSPIKDDAGKIVGASKVAREITVQKLAEKALRETKERMRLATEATGVGIWEWNLLTNQVRWDSQMFRIYGAVPTLDGFVQYHNWRVSVVPEELAEQERKLKDTVIQGGLGFREFRIRRAANGELRHIQAVETVRLNEQGQVEWLVGTNLDITERKLAEVALQESELRFRTMANSMSQLAWIARADGSITWFNQRWYEYTGTTPEQMEGWGWQSVHHPEVLPQVLIEWKAAIESGEPFDMEFPLRGADGHFRKFLNRGQPFKDSTGRVSQWFGTNTDVDELKRAEEKVRQFNAQLEQRVAERTAELESFSYSISHDLRAPVRAICGFVRILQEDYAAKLPEEARRQFNRINANAVKMGQLIDGLLTLSQLGRRPLIKQEVLPDLVVKQVLEELQSEVVGRRVQISVTGLPVCQADPTLLHQVFMNLISNAFKYSRQRDPAIVEIGSRATNGECIYFVKDNGAGFEMKYADKLFGVFQRLHRADAFEGTGVGLAIVQRIIRLHGGEIWAEAAPEQGATFSFTLSQKEAHV